MPWALRSKTLQAATYLLTRQGGRLDWEEFAPNADVDLKKPHESTSPGYALVDVNKMEKCDYSQCPLIPRFNTFNISVVLIEFNPFHLQLNLIFRSVFA